MPYYRVGAQPVDAVILGRCFVYPPGSLLWFEHLPMALQGLVTLLEAPPGAPSPAPTRDQSPRPGMETK